MDRLERLRRGYAGTANPDGPIFHRSDRRPFKPAGYVDLQWTIFAPYPLPSSP
jgi:hypothetical protein